MNGKVHFLAFFLCLLCLGSFTLVAMAADVDDVVESSEVSTSDTSPISVDPVHIPVSEEVVTSVSPVRPQDANGLKAIILGLIGNYDTVVTEHRYTNSNGYTSISVSTEPDYAWIAACAIFVIVLYCLFRMIGGVICGRN